MALARIPTVHGDKETEDQEMNPDEPMLSPQPDADTGDTGEDDERDHDMASPTATSSRKADENSPDFLWVIDDWHTALLTLYDTQRALRRAPGATSQGTRHNPFDYVGVERERTSTSLTSCWGASKAVILRVLRRLRTAMKATPGVQHDVLWSNLLRHIENKDLFNAPMIGTLPYTSNNTCVVAETIPDETLRFPTQDINEESHLILRRDVLRPTTWEQMEDALLVLLMMLSRWVFWLPQCRYVELSIGAEPLATQQNWVYANEPLLKVVGHYLPLANRRSRMVKVKQLLQHNVGVRLQILYIVSCYNALFGRAMGRSASFVIQEVDKGDCDAYRVVHDTFLMAESAASIPIHALPMYPYRVILSDVPQQKQQQGSSPSTTPDTVVMEGVRPMVEEPDMPRGDVGWLVRDLGLSPRHGWTVTDYFVELSQKHGLQIEIEQDEFRELHAADAVHPLYRCPSEAMWGTRTEILSAGLQELLPRSPNGPRPAPPSPTSSTTLSAKMGTTYTAADATAVCGIAKLDQKSGQVSSPAGRSESTFRHAPSTALGYSGIYSGSHHQQSRWPHTQQLFSHVVEMGRAPPGIMDTLTTSPCPPLAQRINTWHGSNTWYGPLQQQQTAPR